MEVRPIGLILKGHALLPQVTTCGQFVFPLDSPHKKPYEMLVLGRYRSSTDNAIRCEMITCLHLQRCTLYSVAFNGIYLSLICSYTCFIAFSSSAVPLEDRRLIVSIPSALHSQKPSLSGQYFKTMFSHFAEYSNAVRFTSPAGGSAATPVIVTWLYCSTDESCSPACFNRPRMQRSEFRFA